MQAKLNETKLGLWKYILVLWYIQCTYMAKNSKEGKEWNVRMQSV